MVREQNAASLLAQSELSTRSTVSIVGFASDSGTKPPVDVVCPPLVLTGAAERERIAQCVGGLRKRAVAEGHGTDHAEALKQAMSYLGQGSPADGPKLVFLLTDGVLDVSDSPRYGVDKTAQQRNDAAQQVIRQTLDSARDKGVQIWPLGFGKVDKNALDQFAAGGFQGSCGPSVPKPSATVVSTSEDVTGALLNSFSSGRCVGVGPVTNSQLGSGRDVEVPVTIPAIATDGSIVVVKNDSRISVEYVDPQGRSVPKAGTSGGSSFQASGESGPVEVLRVVNPEPGDWKVRVTSPPEVPPQNVLTAVTWQGAAQAVLNVDPPSPAVGQQVTVTLKVVLRGRKPVVRPELLQGLSFTAEMTADKAAARPITLQDNGQDPDPAADGTFSGRLTIPADGQQGVSIRGRVTGLGISAADAIANVTIAPQLPTVLVTTTLPTLSSTVEPGGSLPATANISNNSGQRQRIQIGVQADGDAAITVPAGQVVHEVDPGTTTVNFDMEFAGNSPERETTGVVRIVDAADPSRILHEKPFTVKVEFPIPWLRWIAGTVVGGVVLAAVIWVAYFLWARRRDQEVEGLVVQAARDGYEVSLHTAAKKSKRFRFTVDTSESVPRLNIAAVTEPTAFVLTKSRKGLSLQTPYDGQRSMQLGDDVDLGNGLIVRVVDQTYGDGNEPVGVGIVTPETPYSPPGPQQSQDPLM